MASDRTPADGRGVVYLVGAGPGDPKLISVRGLELLRAADAVVYDRLAHPALLAECRPAAERIYAGKRPDRHTLKQEEINDLLVRLARGGKRVVRLKGGDPFIFGRGGEEAERLREAGIPFEVVPGITAAVAAAAYAGVPLTHRGMSASLAIITGHEDPSKPASQHDWARLATATGTLCVYMGMERLALLAGTMIEHGRPASTPAAVIQWGTRAEQRVVSGTLADIHDRVVQAGLGSPAIVVIGEVAALRERLAWFERRPLFGQRVLVTRARQQASRLSEILEEMGAEVYPFPVLRLEPPSDWAGLDAAIARLQAYRFAVFTSSNGVEFFMSRLAETGADIRSLRAEIVAVGSETERALRRFGLKAAVVPPAAQGDAIPEALVGRLRSGDEVLLARADIASLELPAALVRMGAAVTDAVAYRTVPAGQDASDLVELLETGAITIATFTSQSTVTNLLAVLGEALGGGDAGRRRAVSLLESVVRAAIGPVTAEALREAGLPPQIVSEQASVAELAKAVERYAREHGIRQAATAAAD